MAGEGPWYGLELTYLLSSLSWDSWCSQQPGMAGTVRAVTLRGVGTHQDPGMAHHPPLSLPKAPTAGGQPWVPSRDHPWGQGHQGHSPEPPLPSGTARSTGRKPRSHPAATGDEPVPPQDPPGAVPGSLPAFPEPPECSSSPKSHKIQFPQTRQCLSNSPPQGSGDVGHWNSHPELWDYSPGHNSRCQGHLACPYPLSPLPQELPGLPAAGHSPHRESGGGGKGSQGCPEGSPRAGGWPQTHPLTFSTSMFLSAMTARGPWKKREGWNDGRREGLSAGQGTSPWELSPPTRSPAGPGSPGKPLCPGVP